MRPFIRTLIIVGCTFFAGVPAGAATRIPVEATISGVTVYHDRAQVTRSVAVALKPGSQVIAFEGLPVLLQDDSVRVDARGTALTMVTGVEVKRSFLPRTAEKRAGEIENELKLLERKIGSLDAKKTGLLAQKSFIDSIRLAWGERISQQLAVGKPTSSELNEAMGFVGNGMVRVEEQSRDVETDKQQLKEKMDALRRQLQEVTGSHRKESKTVEITLETTKAGTLTLDLSSVVSQATWEPVYDVRLDSGGTVAELAYRAVVKQQTGEDWNNASLVLSTARPSAGGAPPALQPWHIAFYRPRPVAELRQESRVYAKAASMELRDTSAGAAPAEDLPAPVVFQTAEVDSEGTAVTFAIPAAVSVPSDNTGHSMLIALEKLPVTTEYVAVPKLSSSVYLTAELVNKAAWPLLPGTVKIFSGTTFVGGADMKKIASGEKFVLPFGNDDQITVKREELKQHTEAGVFGKNRMGYRYRVAVQNFRKKAQIISIKDQLPLAGDSEITVRLEDATVLPSEKKDDGTLIWKLNLAAGERKEFTYVLVVEYPKGRDIRGL